VAVGVYCRTDWYFGKRRGAGVGIGVLEKRGVTVEMGIWEKGVPPWRWVFSKKKRCRREVL
jgi:hypothetical protein